MTGSPAGGKQEEPLAFPPPDPPRSPHLLSGGHHMDRHDMAEQVRVEQELLRHVMEGLRLSTTWQVQGPDASRKLGRLAQTGSRGTTARNRPCFWRRSGATRV